MIVLLSTMVAITSAIPAKKRERALLELNNLKITNPDDSQNDGPVVAASRQSDLANAIDRADKTATRMRGKSKGKGKGGQLAPGGVLGKGRGKGGAKDCKKKDKSEKAKSGAKGGAKIEKSKGNGKGGGKGKGSRSPTDAPSNSPSEAPSDSSSPSEAPSDAPSDSPSESFEPTAAYCLEEVTPTPMPTAGIDSTKLPRTSVPTFAPTAKPTLPKTRNEPDDAVTTDEGVIDAFCQNLDAIYTADGIDLVNPDVPAAADRVKGGTAAVKNVVKVPVQPSSTDGYKMSITMQVLSVIPPEGIGSALDEVISPLSALYTVGCPEQANVTAFESFSAMTDTGGRKLQETTSTLVVLRNFVCAERTDCGGGAEYCSATCTTDANYIGDMTSDQFKAKLLESFQEYMPMMDNMFSWYPEQDISNKVEIKDDDSAGTSVNGVITGKRSQAQGIKAAPFIGAATGLLAVILLSVLFVRRRNRYIEEVSHLKLDDSADDTLYEGESFENHEYNTRDIHIVGEGDSVISHWTGYTGHGSRNKDNTYEVAYNNGGYRDGVMRGRSADVHQCSSATCDICAESRQAGVSFIKTGNSSIPIRNHSLPSDASREYIAEDTVML